MNLKPIASNMTEVTLNDGTCILFSYKTPVAAMKADWKTAVKTSKKWSNTTTRHINKWLKDVSSVAEKEQDWFNKLV